MQVRRRRIESRGAARHARLRRALTAGVALLAGVAGLAEGTQDAVANGDTRTISIVHEHTKESATVTFRRGGSYDDRALAQLNWLLRDWRRDEPTKMDPRLFDLLWEVVREVGAAEPVRVVSAYRAPETNSMLRRRSRAVSEHSQHMNGRAIDFYIPNASVDRIRAAGMRLQRGGVGYYPNAFNPFTHLDTGSVRAWPRMTRDQLARLFPDGRTVHLPRDGKPMPGYEEARAEVLARGGTVAGLTAYAEAETGTGRKSFWASLFGGDDEDTEYYRQVLQQTAQARGGRRTPAPQQTAVAGAALTGGYDGDGAREDGPRLALAYAPEPVRTATTPPAAQVSDARDAGGFRWPWERAGAASAPGAAEAAVAIVPVPPPRPGDADPQIAAGVPLPPARPVEVALLGPTPALPLPAPLPPARPALASVPPGDDREQLRSLFAALSAEVAPAPGPVRAVRTAVRQAPAGDLLGDATPSLRVSFAAQADPLPARFGAGRPLAR